MYFKLGYWLFHFKVFTSIIIPKPNKKSYNSSKLFKPIVLLNTIGKLIEKVIGDKLQFYSILNNFIHPSQLSSLKQRLISDVSIALTHFIHSGWVNHTTTSTLAFNITQSFLLLNYWVLLLIFRKAGFDPKVRQFFSNYLVGRKTWYF